MPSTEAINEMLAAAAYHYVGAFEDAPATGGAAIGARVPFTFGPPSGAVRTQAGGSVLVPIDVGASIRFVGFYDAATGGTLQDQWEVESPPLAFPGGGWYELSGITLTGSNP